MGWASVQTDWARNQGKQAFTVGLPVRLSFYFWGIEKHEPMGWIRMHFSVFSVSWHYTSSGSQNGR